MFTDHFIKAMHKRDTLMCIKEIRHKLVEILDQDSSNEDEIVDYDCELNAIKERINSIYGVESEELYGDLDTLIKIYKEAYQNSHTLVHQVKQEVFYDMLRQADNYRYIVVGKYSAIAEICKFPYNNAFICYILPLEQVMIEMKQENE